MKNNWLLSIMLIAAVMTSCGRGESQAGGDADSDNLRGWQWIADARRCLADSDFVAARNCIDSLRTSCPMALNAREQGILLLDSIELGEARQQLKQAEAYASRTDLDIYARDSADTELDRAVTKVRFYEKKLTHDIANQQNH